MRYLKILFATVILASLMSGIVFAQDTTMTVTSEGYIGIGTTTPSEKLTLVNGRLLINRNQTLVDPSAIWDGETIRLMDGDGQVVLYSKNTGAHSGAIVLKEVDEEGLLNNQWSITRNTGETALDFRFGSLANFGHDPSLMTIHSNGNVGIGTTIPNAALHVVSSEGFSSPQLEIHQTGADGFTRFRFRNPSDHIWDIAEAANDQLRFFTGTGGLDVLTLTTDGYVGIGTNGPTNPLEMASGAHVTAGGVWTNASSIEYKENISGLTLEEAVSTLGKLNPVKYNYKVEKEEEYVGFIAEDVPDLVANNDRKSLSSMDIVAVLTKVVQQQQKKIEELEARLNARQ